MSQACRTEPAPRMTQREPDARDSLGKHELDQANKVEPPRG
jgi:hypothetical protein